MTDIFLFAYLVAISFVALILTVYDKNAARKGKWRIPEKALMLVALSGGATVMYAAMHMIRHKTKHKKFMIGLPVFIFIHIALIIYYFYFF